MSATVPSTTPRTVFGTWISCPANQNLDLEAQVVIGTYEPGPFVTVASHAQPTDVKVADPFDDFFGIARTSHGIQDGRHDTRYASYQDDLPPPPYVEEVDLHTYNSVAEPPTLAMYLFKFGFLFPLSWLTGIVILLCPLTPPEHWEPTKTEAGRKELLGLLRRTEIKWAKRCLIAFSVLALVIVALVVVIGGIRFCPS
ncbi:uncharacterized protein PHACADRAFT_160057 [Phanerochaete carnosa HHB-10118-sp]|uniref:Uncharacterized protein n=1 Tax=Phanerochaete carnosa (strain HHB-10118-sp) TaxID=650164 RepID=K5WBE6_PHACS|nr:uncharacterized protein PHACADRAFT_160057 [Phanerochaete carnosa HHB-10118-sp]EKM56530.1 hypothetical protein PHACADRAFT_160057 [Phanerochaete carnosa HHB-10118-sp]